MGGYDMKRIRIVLADDHILLMDAIKKMLEPEFEIVGTFANGQALVQGAPALNPDLIVIDIGMPLMNGLSAGQRLKQLLPEVKLIYLTMHVDEHLVAEAFRIGASGYVTKSSAANELVNAINEVAMGRSYITPMMAPAMRAFEIQNGRARKNPQTLTLRQQEVLQLLAEGHSMKEVAFMLNVTPRTVAFHKYAMMENLHVRTSAELIQFAVKSSIVTV
jgi:DNA-binding NarL/FixJ family response regulator